LRKIQDNTHTARLYEVFESPNKVKLERDPLKFCLAYLDDIICSTPLRKSYEETLKLHFQSLEKIIESNIPHSGFLDKNSVGKLDKEKNSHPINARTLAYATKWDGKEVKTTVPYPVTFEFEMNGENSEKLKKYMLFSYLFLYISKEINQQYVIVIRKISICRYYTFYFFV
jgi:hypothetical protein